MTMIPVAEYTENQLPSTQLRQFITLVNSVWPNPNKTIMELVEEEISFALELNYESIKRFVVWEENDAIAHAKIFPRTIFSDKMKIKVLALASVCTAVGRRGQGYGKAVVEQAFRFVDQSEFELSLFQTGIPAFYEKLGARSIHNTFINSKNELNPDANPWWDEYIMIYPSNFNFPRGIIDLNGPGY